jgi:hypothetical protein
MASPLKTGLRILQCSTYWNGIIKEYWLATLRKNNISKTVNKLIWIWFQNSPGQVKLKKVMLTACKVVSMLIRISFRKFKTMYKAIGPKKIKQISQRLARAIKWLYSKINQNKYGMDIKKYQVKKIIQKII